MKNQNSVDKMTRWANGQPRLRMMDGGSFGDAASLRTSGAAMSLGGMFNNASAQPMSGQVAPAAGTSPAPQSQRGSAMRTQMQTYNPLMAMPSGLAMADGGMVAGPKPNPLTPSAPQTPIPDWFRYSLRDGREVPGQGKGDTVPALLEPEEFVVSNSMMERKPGLRDALHSIRDETLEAEGKDPREVDAKQVRQATLRAQDGFSRPNRFVTPIVDQGYSPGNARAQIVVPGASAQREGAPAGVSGSGPDLSGGQSAVARIPDRSPGTLLKQAFPVTSTILGATGDDAATAASRGDYASAAGHGLRGAALGIGGLYHDTLGRHGAGLTDAGSSPISAVVRAGKTMVTGESTPQPSLRADPTVAAAPGSNQAAYDAANADFSRASLRRGTSPNTEEGIVTRKGNSFSGVNVSNYGNQNVIPAMDPGLIAETLRNPDGSKWTAADNARMAANIRDGVDPKAGTSGQVRDPISEFAANAPKRGEFGYRQAQNDLARMRNEAVQTRGQDIQAAGSAMTARTASLRAQQDQVNADRTYQAGREDAQATRGDKARDDKRQGGKAFAERITTMVGVDKDGKPDAAAASAVTNGANAFLADKLAEMDAVLKTDPGNKRAATIREDILKNGLDGIDEDTLRNLILGQRGNQVARANDGWKINPWAGTAVQTDRPVTSLRLQKNMILPNQYVTDNDQTIPASAVEDNPDLKRLVRPQSLR